MARLKTLPPRIAKAPERSLAQVNPSSWRSGKTTAQRGYGGKWQRERLRYLTANPLCRYCEAEGRVVEATVVDHIIPHRGDQKLFWNRKNWQPLCKPCHDSVKRAEELGGG
ncbi:HNH endonuclease [Alcanivorax quisquiliarum]|uniref:HNH endonuclease n=1 Tax=Alcanivorax quisquiliarum TaxID=2933565 RepID=UPI00352E845F